MATIHLMTGFIGFGKTTLAQKLAQTLPAVCLTHDTYMVKLYGRNMPYEEFHSNYQKVDDMLWLLAAKIIKCDCDVIMDYGFWNKEKRQQAYLRAKALTPNVIFHQVECDMNVAKARILKRSQENPDELYITENEFDTLAKQYHPIDSSEKYDVIYHQG